MMEEIHRKSVSPEPVAPAMGAYEAQMVDPIVKITTAQPRTKSNTKRSHLETRNESKRVVKSIGMLQAYGEFDRFMRMSKQHLKETRRA